MSNTLIDDIRKIEAHHGFKPSDITESPNGITVTINKSVLYQYDDTVPRSKLQRFWRWLNDSDDSFNAEKHKETIQQTLGDSKSVIGVSVRRRYKKLPIPYFSIPIPFFKQTGGQVRDYEDLGVQNTKVSLTFSRNCSSKEAITALLKAATISQPLDPNVPLPSAVRRHPNFLDNPIKWILHGLAWLVPNGVAKIGNSILPNKWIAATRLNEWGADSASTQITSGLFGSAAVATLANTVVTPLVLSCITLGGPGGTESHPMEKMGNAHLSFRKSKKIESFPYERDTTFLSGSSRFSAYAFQTREKVYRTSIFKSPAQVIEEAKITPQLRIR